MDHKSNRPGSNHSTKNPQKLTSPSNRGPQPHHGVKPKFEASFSQISQNLLNFKLGDPDFDEINMQLAEGHNLHREDYLNLLNMKLNKLVEILQKEENDAKIVEDQNKIITETLAERRRISEELLDSARQQLQEQLERHGQLLQEQQQGNAVSQVTENELRAKEEAILQLNRNIQQLMTEFVTARDRNDRVEEKLRRVKEGKRAEEEELQGPRPGSPEYEEKMNRLWGLERTIKEEEDTQRSLETENDQLKHQLKELAPHSVLSPDDKSPKDVSSLVDLEKYADMKPEDIHEEIESLKAQASSQQEVINRLEARNKEDIDAINIQKGRIEDLRAQYVENMERFYQAKKSREDSLIGCNQLEDDIAEMIKKFNNLSAILGRETGAGGLRKGSYESSLKDAKVRSPVMTRHEHNRSEPHSVKSHGKDVYVPTPSTLKVHPSKGEIKENL